MYKIPCERGEVNMGETGRSIPMQVKNQRTRRFRAQQNKPGHHPLWNVVKFIDRGSHWYTGKEVIRIRLHPNNFSRDINAIESWMLGYQ